MEFEKLLEISPYALSKEEKETIMTERLTELTELHRENCREYRKILEAVAYNPQKVKSYKDIPFLPVRLFKERELKSISNEKIVKVMTSSGTSGQAVSKIYLDKKTSGNQQKAMVKIVNDYTGSGRMPMVILDCPSVVKNRNMFSARGAGILGFSIFGAKKIYALNDDMQLDVEGLRDFLKQYQNQKILLFGFTFMVWQYFYKELLRLKEKGVTFDFSNGILIHGGGWKKLINEAVSPNVFHDKLKCVCGLDSIHDYYGMVEQTGCIYMQCECGHLHASLFSDVIIRRPEDFSECGIGERGIIQVVSTIPESYPGHSLLTEDEGIILGEDDCPCGRKGKYFKIFGRLKNAEIRGCSDTYAAGWDKNQSSHTEGEHKILSKVTYLTGNEDLLKKMKTVPAKEPFDKGIMEFLSDLSRELIRTPEAKVFPDVISFGFWLRNSSMKELKQRFGFKDGNVHVGRGIAFHIAPSNVPVNYAYSLVSGLLCGNANIVRVPTKEFAQVTIINTAIKKVLEAHPEIKPYICLVRYERDYDINNLLSDMCDVRIVWGGDATVGELRKSKLPVRASEVTFADRYSLAVIDSDAYMLIEDKDKTATDFYNDTYLTDQNACTSPKVVVWTGAQKEKAKEIFWDRLYAEVKKKYIFQPIMGVDKLSQSFLAATAEKDFGKVKLLVHESNLLVRVRVTRLSSELMEYKGNSGYFYEYDMEDVLELADFCNDTHCQTIGIIGDKKMVMPLLKLGLKGVDRVVKVGHTMEFDLNWDGYNLAERLTRTVVI